MFLATDITIGLDIRHGTDHQSLTEAQAAALELALQDDWSIDRHVSAEESLGLMVSTPGSDKLETVFFVEAGPLGMSLSIMRGDAFEHLGCYGSVIALVAAVRATR